MTIERTVKEDVARTRNSSARKTGFYEHSAEHYGREACKVTVSWTHIVGRQSFEAVRYRCVVMANCHASLGLHSLLCLTVEHERISCLTIV